MLIQDQLARWGEGSNFAGREEKGDRGKFYEKIKCPLRIESKLVCIEEMKGKKSILGKERRRLSGKKKDVIHLTDWKKEMCLGHSDLEKV